MGQEAYAMFPALARMQAETQLAKAQAGAYGIQQQQFQQGNQAASAFGNAFGNGPLPGAQPGPAPQAPAPGQVSVPMNPYATGGAPAPGVRVGGMGQGGGVRVPPPTSPPAMGGMVTTGGTPAGTEDQLTQPGDSGAGAPPPAAPAAPPVPAQPGTPHKWTPAPGEQNNTPDGSRPRSLDDVMGALKKANPKADPATLARAAALYMPWMTEEDQVLLRQEMMKNTAAITGARIDAQRDIASQKVGSQQDIAAAKLASTEKIAYANMGLREKLAAARQDERYADLAAKTDNWDKKIQIAQQQVELGTNTLAQKALIAAQRAKHDAVYNLVSTMFSNGDMTSEEKAAIQAQADQELTDAQSMSAPAKAVVPTGGRAVKTKSIAVPGGVAPIGPPTGSFQ